MAFYSTLLLALAGLAAANKVGKRLQKDSQKNLLKHGGSSNKNNQAVGFSAADDCPLFEAECDSYFCIPRGGDCCADGDGSYCDVGKYCVSGGCCPLGRVCSGDPEGCDFGDEPCGDDHCMPEGSVCCGDGYYCDAGETCTGDGYCDPNGGGDDDNDDGGKCSSS